MMSSIVQTMCKNHVLTKRIQFSFTVPGFFITPVSTPTEVCMQL
uniref:Uncharacterized protein n=1 Tax=Anguilla anguilla TaxID=7936 RepID=A0A0E9RKX7_ANGAN